MSEKNDSITTSKKDRKRKEALRLIEQWLNDLEKNNELKKKE